jgi:hypothetical protein
MSSKARSEREAYHPFVRSRIRLRFFRGFRERAASIGDSLPVYPFVLALFLPSAKSLVLFTEMLDLLRCLV